MYICLTWIIVSAQACEVVNSTSNPFRFVSSATAGTKRGAHEQKYACAHELSLYFILCSVNCSVM